MLYSFIILNGRMEEERRKRERKSIGYSPGRGSGRDSWIPLSGGTGPASSPGHPLPPPPPPRALRSPLVLVLLLLVECVRVVGRYIYIYVLCFCCHFLRRSCAAVLCTSCKECAWHYTAGDTSSNLSCIPPLELYIRYLGSKV